MGELAEQEPHLKGKRGDFEGEYRQAAKGFGPKSKFIQSTWEPFTEGQQLDHNILLNWLKQYEMTYHHIHISGHTFGAQLKEIIKEIPAKKILPIHTLHPELFQDLSDKKTLMLKNDESISL